MLRRPDYVHDSLWAPLFIVMSGSNARRTKRRTLSYPFNEATEVRNK